MTTLASLQSSVGRKKIMSKDLEEMCAEWYHMKQGMLYLAADDTLTAMRLNAQDKCFLYGNIPPTRPVSRENCIKVNRHHQPHTNIQIYVYIYILYHLSPFPRACSLYLSFPPSPFIFFTLT